MMPALNNLRTVELSCLIFHEAHDPTRLARVREEITDEAVQRNLVIVAPYEDRYLLLDGVGLEKALHSVEEIEVSEKASERGCLAEAWLPGGEKLFARARQEGIV